MKATGIDRHGDVVDVYELAPLQQGMLFHALSSGGAGVDIQQVVVRVDEVLDVAVFEQAFGEVMARHPVLRTRFRWADVEQPCQEVLAHAELVATVADWGDVAPGVAEARFADYVRADRRRDFDLSCAPMMRLFVARFPGGQSRVLWTFHHALLDGRSFPVVLREWFGLYDAARRGEVMMLPPARPYRDYIMWRRSLDVGPAETFWRAMLDGFDTPTPVGIDTARSGEPGEEPFSACEQHLCPALTSQIRAAAERAQVTVNTLVQAAWAVLLARYSGQSDIVFGATRAGRITAIPDSDTIAGLFINTVPMRIEVDDNAEIVPWLGALRAQQIALRPHEHTPLATVQAASAVTRGTALFDSIIVYDHHTIDARMQMPGRHFEYTGQTNYPLALMAYGDDGTGHMLLRLEYDTQRFSAAAITAMLAHFINLLTQLADGNATHLGDLSVLSAEERVALVGDCAIPTVPTRDVTLHAGFARQAAATPQAIALSAETPCGRVELSYAELDRRAEAVAAHLRSLGVNAGDVVGLRVHRSPDVVIGILAILKTGAAYLPLDPLYPTERVAFMLADADVDVVLTQRAFADELAALPASCVCLDEPLPPPPAQAPPPAVPGSGEDLAYVMYTSGSTGQPKGVRVTHHNVLRLFTATIARFGFGPHDVWTLWHSYAFDISVSEFWGALLVGGRLVVVAHDTSRDPATFRALVEREHVTVLSQTPTGFQAFIDADHSAAPGAFTLRYILLCGEALHLQTLQPWFDRYGDTSPQIINMYGPTETTLYVTYQHITQADLNAGAGSIIGKPLPDIRIYLLDTAGQPVPTGVAGELYIAGAGVAAGYLNRPDLTAARFLPDPFHGGPMYRSGDLARRLHTGELEYLGRIDQQVKIRGFRIELGEIETTIAQHPAIKAVAVIDREATPGDKKLIAYLVTNTTTPPPTLITDLRQTLHTHLPEYMVPAHFHYLDTLPLTTSGKLDRKALPTPEHQHTHNTKPYTAPRNPAEQTIANIWKDVLHIDKVGLDDHFFELGGDSFLSIRVHAQLKDKLHTDLPVVAVLQYPTVRALARHVTGQNTSTTTTNATMDRARKQREAHAHRRNLTGRR
jgi:amino acid adenylation domain-containing protein